MFKTQSLFAFAALALSSANLQASELSSELSYTEKRAAIEARLSLSEDQFSPALERIHAIHDIYALIFESGYGEYFSSDSDVVRHISLKNYRGFSLDESDMPMVTSLRGHTLFWPLGYDVSELVADNLAAERTTLQHLNRLERLLKSEHRNLSISVPNSSFHQPTNRTALQNLWNFRESIQATELKTALRNMTYVLVNNERALHPNAQFTIDRWTNFQGHTLSKLQINLGFEGKLDSNTFMDSDSIDLSLRTALLKGMGIQSSYFLRGHEYAQALQNFQNILSDATLKSKLRNNGVKSVEFDAEADQSRDIFKEGVLTLGLEEAQMREIINLLF